MAFGGSTNLLSRVTDDRDQPVAGLNGQDLYTACRIAKCGEKTKRAGLGHGTLLIRHISRSWGRGLTEERLQALAEVKKGTGNHRANALENEKA